MEDEFREPSGEEVAARAVEDEREELESRREESATLDAMALEDAEGANEYTDEDAEAEEVAQALKRAEEDYILYEKRGLRIGDGEGGAETFAEFKLLHDVKVRMADDEGATHVMTLHGGTYWYDHGQTVYIMVPRAGGNMGELWKRVEEAVEQGRAEGDIEGEFTANMAFLPLSAYDHIFKLGEVVTWAAMNDAEADDNKRLFEAIFSAAYTRDGAAVREEPPVPREVVEAHQMHYKDDGLTYALDKVTEKAISGVTKLENEPVDVSASNKKEREGTVQVYLTLDIDEAEGIRADKPLDRYDLRIMCTMADMYGEAMETGQLEHGAAVMTSEQIARRIVRCKGKPTKTQTRMVEERIDRMRRTFVTIDSHEQAGRMRGEPVEYLQRYALMADKTNAARLTNGNMGDAYILYDMPTFVVYANACKQVTKVPAGMLDAVADVMNMTERNVKLLDYIIYRCARMRSSTAPADTNFYRINYRTMAEECGVNPSERKPMQRMREDARRILDVLKSDDDRVKVMTEENGRWKPFIRDWSEYTSEEDRRRRRTTANPSATGVQIEVWQTTAKFDAAKRRGLKAGADR